MWIPAVLMTIFPKCETKDHDVTICPKSASVSDFLEPIYEYPAYQTAPSVYQEIAVLTTYVEENLSFVVALEI
jgi:hypothetical protein